MSLLHLFLSILLPPQSICAAVDLPVKTTNTPNLNRRERGRVHWDSFVFRSTPFKESVSTILSPIVAKLSSFNRPTSTFGNTLMNCKTIASIFKQRFFISLSHISNHCNARLILTQTSGDFPFNLWLLYYSNRQFGDSCFAPLRAIARYSNSWEVNHKQYKEIKVHIPCQIPNIVVQSIENQGVGYPEREK